MGMFGVCGECMGACGCARVCAGRHGYAWGMCGYARVSVGVCGCMREFKGVHGVHGVGVCGQVWPSVHRWAQVCVSVHWYTQVCGSAWVSTSVCVMNSQNNYWRIESLHLRTFISILYEFFP